MNTRYVHPFLTVASVLAVIIVCVAGASNAQEPPTTDQRVIKQQETSAPIPSTEEAMGLLKSDEGTWDAAVSLWPKPGGEPIKCRAVVTARMAVGGKYLEQQFDGTFGPELGNKTWTSLSYTGFASSTGQYEAVRMASTDSPMIVVRGKANSDKGKGVSIELVGEYMMMGARATERDLIRHEGPDKCVIESWMSLAGSKEFKGAEFVLTRAKPFQNSETNQAKEKPRLRLGNFSVSLTVKDLDASRAFYEKLGFRVFGGDPKTFLILQNETSTIGLFQGMFDKNILTFNPGWDRTAATLPDFDDVREIQRVLKDQGLVLTTEANESTTGPANLTLLDPDGNQILLDQHVPSPQK